MRNNDQPKGKPLALDRDATSASPSHSAFLAPPKGSPVYYGFAVLENVAVDGSIFETSTDFEAEPTDCGDAFVIAPDGNRAGLVWEVCATGHIGEVLPFEAGMGVWAVSFPTSDEQSRKRSSKSRRCSARLESALGRLETVVSLRELSQLS